MNWIYLFIAGVAEIGWPLGLKLSQTMQSRAPGIILACICMAFSGVFLLLAQKTIPIGTAYAVWTGIGAAGTLLVGIIFFGDSASIGRMFSALLIIIGIVGLRLTH